MTHDRDLEHEALLVAYRRLRTAAQHVINCSEYPAAEGSDARVYKHQLEGLRRELEGVLQPTPLSWMSPT